MGRPRLGMTRLGWLGVVAALAMLVLGVTGCGGGGSDDGASAAAKSDLSGTVRVDGSSIVAPLTEALAAEFQDANPGVTVSVGVVGTGAGFEELCARRIDVGDAAWVMDEKARGLCRQARVAYTEVPVGFEALAVLVNSGNPVGCLTIEQLEAIWDPLSTISSWGEIPDLKEGFNDELALFAPASDSGTFEYFTEATDGVAGGTRGDYTDVGEDEGAMIAGVAGARGGMGYLNLLSVPGSENTVKALEVDNGKGCVVPSVETVQDRSYVPLSRPLFLDLRDAALNKPAVKAFVDYYLEKVTGVAESVGFVPLTEEQLQESEAAAKKAGA
jgi:phosphate transport system substrate-binding protein